MPSQHIEKTATTTADPHTVYALLRDGASYPAWSPIESFELETEGEGEPEGVGAVRIFRSGKVTGRDTIAELVAGPPPRLHARVQPAREELPRQRRPRRPSTAAPRSAGCRSSTPRSPAPGKLMRKGLDSFIAGMTDGLAEHASKTAVAA